MMPRAQELTDHDIETLIKCHKVVREDKFQKIKFVEKDGYRRFNLEVESSISECSLGVFCRQAVDDPMDFSAGLTVYFQDGSNTNLMRCNGLHGQHRNKIEKTIIKGKHIHIATERYIRRGNDAEAFAVAVDDDYNNVESAFECLLDRCNIDIEGVRLFKF